MSWPLTGSILLSLLVYLAFNFLYHSLRVGCLELVPFHHAQQLPLLPPPPPPSLHLPPPSQVSTSLLNLVGAGYSTEEVDTAPLDWEMVRVFYHVIARCGVVSNGYTSLHQPSDLAVHRPNPGGGSYS